MESARTSSSTIPSTAADYVDDKLVVDLSQYVYDEEIGMADIVNSLPEAILAEATGFSDGGMYALPAVTTGPILFYNKTMYDELGLEVPTTWEQLAENSKVIYETYGIPGFAADSLTDLMHMLIMQAGNEYIDIENKCVAFDTESTLEWLTWFGDNVQAGYFGLNPTGDYWSNDFNAKLVGAYSGSCAGDAYIFPDGFEYAVAPLPTTIEKAWFPSWNRGPIVFNKGEEANLGAYEFIKFFLQPENNTVWAKSMNAISPYGTTQECEAYKEFAAELPASLVAVEDSLYAAGTLPSINGSYAVRTALQEMATMVAGGMDPAEALAQCVATSNAAMAGTHGDFGGLTVSPPILLVCIRIGISRPRGFRRGDGGNDGKAKTFGIYDRCAVRDGRGVHADAPQFWEDPFGRRAGSGNRAGVSVLHLSLPCRNYDRLLSGSARHSPQRDGSGGRASGSVVLQA